MGFKHAPDMQPLRDLVKKRKEFSMSRKKETATKLKLGTGLRITARIASFTSSLKNEYDTVEIKAGKNADQSFFMDIPKGIGEKLMSKDLDLVLVQRKST